MEEENQEGEKKSLLVDLPREEWIEAEYNSYRTKLRRGKSNRGPYFSGNYSGEHSKKDISSLAQEE